MSKRSEKMYANSPRIVSDKDGNKVIQKGQKADGSTLPGDPAASERVKKSLILKQKHEKERLELAQKHEQEQEGFEPETATTTPATPTT